MSCTRWGAWSDRSASSSSVTSSNASLCRAAWKPRYRADLVAVAAPGGEKKKRGQGNTRPGPLYPLLALRLMDVNEDTLKSWYDLEAKSGEHQAAIELLTGGLRLTAAAGFVRTYVELGPGLADLLRAIDEPELDGYIASILAAFPSNHPIPRGPSLLLDSPAATLTERELEVLALLASPMAPEEIAHALSISYSTVRQHTSHIYEKLGVNKRRHAVLAATELGLLK